MGASPEIAELFRETDFERQRRVLRDSLYVMLVAAGTESGPAHDEVERLAARHVELGVTPEMFDVWLDALIQAAREHDTHFTDALEHDWRASFGGPMALMKSVCASGRKSSFWRLSPMPTPVVPPAPKLMRDSAIW